MKLHKFLENYRIEIVLVLVAIGQFLALLGSFSEYALGIFVFVVSCTGLWAYDPEKYRELGSSTLKLVAPFIAGYVLVLMIFVLSMYFYAVTRSVWASLNPVALVLFSVFFYRIVEDENKDGGSGG